MRTASRLVVLGILIALAAGCGERDDAPAKPAKAAEPVGSENVGSVVQVADCSDWRGGTRAEREATIDELRSELTPTHSKTAASPLADDRAYAILDKACAQSYATSMRLYKLYSRAQGFSPLSQ